MRRNAILFCGLLGVALLVGACEDDPSPQNNDGAVADTQMGIDGGTCGMSFVTPATGSKIRPTAASDCNVGVTRDIVVAIQADDGTVVTLSVPGAADGGADGGAQDLAATVSGAQARFPGVLLPIGEATLSATAGDCAAVSAITVECSVPTCAITAPIISAAHPSLNGVPFIQGGDRVSSPGSDYQAAFQVTTDAEDGQPVQLVVNDSSTVLVAKASGGKATFAGVTLSPDATYAVDAVCTAATGLQGTDSKTFAVDTQAPDLTVAQPADGQHFDPEALVAGKFTVCAKTTAADALTPGLGVLNLCAAIGTASPTCIEATNAEPGTGVCPAGSTALALDCPGSAPFTVNVTLKDAAGNPTSKAITGVTCASNRPSVSIVSPLGDASPFDTTAKHLLAANSAQAFKDQDATKAGAQWTVVACSNTAGKATLYAGQAGGALTAVAATIDTVPATVADNCPGNYGYVARFTDATLPESAEDDIGTVTSATRLRVEMVDATNTNGASPVVDLWVDSIAPTLTPWSPSPLCGRIQRQGTDWTTAVKFATSAATSQIVVTSGGTPATYPPQSYANKLANYGSVTFKLGSNDVTASASEPSGNASSIDSGCSVTVGNVPLVSWSAPTTGTKLCASTTTALCTPDTDATTDGWQGVLDVYVTVSGAAATTGTVTFTTGSTALGSAAIDATGHAKLALTTDGLPDSDALVVTATTSDIAGTGVGTQSATFVVDTTVPGAITDLTATVKDRRQTSFHLSWTAPSDAGQSVRGYDVRVSRNAITAANFASAERVAFTGVPASVGADDGVDVTDRLIETKYNFAVAAIDLAGNRGQIATIGDIKAHFEVSILTPPAGGPANERFGYAIDGSTDLNGDNRSDLVIGTFGANNAYLFTGADAFNPTSPTTVFVGNTSFFGVWAAVIGDIDDDGGPEIAISAPLAGNGAVFIYRHRSNWPAVLSESDADYVITADASFAGGFFGFPVARVGDFDGDGVDDFAISAQSANGGAGRVTIIRGSKKDENGNITFSSLTLPSASRAIVVDGEAGTALGTAVAAFGGAGPGGAKLVIGAPQYNSKRGRVYAFRSQLAPGGILSVTDSEFVVDGTTANQQFGITINMLGPVLGTDFGIAVGDYYQVFSSPLSNGAVDLRFTRSSSGPFSCGIGDVCRMLVDTAATTANNAYGYITMGGAFSGSSATVSIIGDSASDIVTAAYLEGTTATRIYILDGRHIVSLPAVSDIVSTSDVILNLSDLPSGWKGTSPRGGLVKDVNGDGYGDIAIGEYNSSIPGRVVVFW